MRISPGTLSEAVVARLGDLLEASKNHFWGLGGLSETSWGHLGGPWAAKTIFERFWEDFDSQSEVQFGPKFCKIHNKNYQNISHKINLLSTSIF